MEQCNAVGSTARSSPPARRQHQRRVRGDLHAELVGSGDGHWDCFARDWIAAQIGHDPTACLAFNPDTNMNGVLEAEEAFGYADAIHYSGDSPNFSESSEAGGDIALSQHYVWWWWWCWIILPVLEEYYRPWPPDPEFYEKLHKVLPELQELVSPELDRAARDEEEPGEGQGCCSGGVRRQGPLNPSKIVGGQAADTHALNARRPAMPASRNVNPSSAPRSTRSTRLLQRAPDHQPLHQSRGRTRQRSGRRSRRSRRPKPALSCSRTWSRGAGSGIGADTSSTTPRRVPSNGCSRASSRRPRTYSTRSTCPSG